MIRTLASVGNIRSLVVLRGAFNVDVTKCSVLGCCVSVRNVRARRRRLLPVIAEQLDTPRRRRPRDVLDETEIDYHHDGVMERIETGVNYYDEEDFEQKRRKTLAKKMFIKQKILEKKFFKQPAEPNILSWNTKEQIRLLNRKDPDEWTVDRLADSFPVSRDSIIRILKSTYRPTTDAEIAKHDQRARNHFLAFKSALDDEQIAFHDHVMSKMKMEAGSLLNDAGKQSERSLVQVDKIGMFEAIVKDIPVKYGQSVKGLENNSFSKKNKGNHERNIHQNTKLSFGSDRTSGKTSRSMAADDKRLISQRWRQNEASSEEDTKARFKRTDVAMSRAAADTNAVHKINWNRSLTPKYGEVEGNSESRYHRDVAHNRSMATRDGKYSKTRLTKEHESNDSLENDRVVYDDNGEFLYRIP
ncbi:uncharacterized protein LOC121377263 [Gigantopelta aegis]|uniref:uncharacterized protein LOC121377263 n=1 Tax=Gigantopelta aegis TaxID=1735272 RepID=UPI001B88CC7E|nr:uncharacterized protein LOC121377263 [Gigantopelta aegis]